jgi:CRISPR-associated protein Csh1
MFGNFYGEQTPYKFYTVDKPGYICGLIKSDCWKNFPLCEDCMLILEEGKTYIEKNLNFRFYGLNYYIFPNLMLDNEEAREEVNEILKLSAEKQIKMEDAKRITDDEEDILDWLKEYKDYLCYDFLFLSKEQSAERILLTIEDISPSRLRTIFNAKAATDKRFGDKFPFHFGRIRTFLAKSDESKRNYDLDKYFLEVVNKIFTGLSIEPGFIIQMYMKKIRRDFASLDNDSDRFFYDTRNAIISLDFMRELGVIQFEEDIMEVKVEFEEFFKEYSKTFSMPVDKGIFLLGTLTQDLLDKQRGDRDSMPFYKQLKGLRMAERDIKGLLPKVQNKMEEYEWFTPMRKTIANNISKYLMSSGDNWGLSIDEINFYFSAGMNMKNEAYGYLAKILGGEKDE